MGWRIRAACREDLVAIKALADGHKHELGFVLRPALAKSIDRSELYVALDGENIIGFVDFHHRRDEQTTLYHILVDQSDRNKGVGRALIVALLRAARVAGKSYIQLKCPQDLDANGFYRHLGFRQVDIEQGKNRSLAVWRLSL